MEIDRARQETRKQARIHAALDKDRQQRETALEGALGEARQVAAAAARELAAERARREVLEVQLRELRDRMAAALTARTPKPARKSAAAGSTSRRKVKDA